MTLEPVRKTPLKNVSLFFVFVLCSLTSIPAIAIELGFGFRSLGFMFEAGHKLSESFNARLAIGGSYYVGFDEMNSSEEPEPEGVMFSQLGDWEFKQASALIDYHPWKGNFRVTAGVTDNRIIWNVENLGDNGFNFNGREFSDDTVELTRLRVQFTDGISPYFGVGWATGFDREKGFSFNGDIGVFYTANFQVDFIAKCTSYAAKAQCGKIQESAKKEQISLSENSILILPMIGLGLSYKF